jgi:hypothetical protein
MRGRSPVSRGIPPDESVPTLRASAELVFFAIEVRQALDTEADRQVADGVIRPARQCRRTRVSALSEHGAAGFVRLVAMTVAQALDAATRAIAERLVRVRLTIGAVDARHASPRVAAMRLVLGAI